MRCLESGYAANVEAVITAVPESLPIDGLPEAKVYDTPDTPTIATLVDVGEHRAGPRGDRGGHAEERLAQGASARWRVGAARGRCAWRSRGRRETARRCAGPGRVRAARPTPTSLRTPSWSKGYIGPKALLANGVRYLVDPRVVDGTSWITGADEPGKHVVGLVAGRDFVADGTIEAAEVRDGDPSPDGAGPLVAARGIEIGPHLPARPQVHRRVLRGRARRGRQAGAADHGLLWHRGVPAGRGDRRTAP